MMTSTYRERERPTAPSAEPSRGTEEVFLCPRPCRRPCSSANGGVRDDDVRPPPSCPSATVSQEVSDRSSGIGRALGAEDFQGFSLCRFRLLSYELSVTILYRDVFP